MLNIIEGELFVLYKANLLKTTLRALFNLYKLGSRRIMFRSSKTTEKLLAADYTRHFVRMGTRTTPTTYLRWATHSTHSEQLKSYIFVN
jgi:hypothetical protein